MKTTRNLILLLALSGTAGATTEPGSVLEATRPGDTMMLRTAGNGLSKSLPARLVLERFDVYAPGARLFEVRSDGTQVELPRSNERFFLSSAKEGFGRFYLALQPDGRQVRGVRFEQGEAIELTGRVDGDLLVLDSRKRVLSPDGGFQCATGRHVHEPDPAVDAEPSPAMATPKGASLHQAIVAVDTDTELLSLKFDNNTSSASSYLANLFAGMNVFYERDLDVRLVQGTTFLRTGSDPYSATSTNAQLNEVGAYWKDTPALQSVERAFVMFLSGKSPSANSASGIAWILENGNYCAAKGTVQGGGSVSGHYSATQVFRFNGSTAAHDVGIVGHELGHNFGVSHTHCTNLSGQQPRSTNTIDRCFNGEAGDGCYGGAVSCPTDNSIPGRGSLMSYCNFGGSNGANCGAVLQEFHPVHQGVLDARIATNIGNGCLTPVSSGSSDRVFADGFE